MRSLLLISILLFEVYSCNVEPIDDIENKDNSSDIEIIFNDSETVIEDTIYIGIREP